jgi:predicted amidohydrolase
MSRSKILIEQIVEPPREWKTFTWVGNESILEVDYQGKILKRADVMILMAKYPEDWVDENGKSLGDLLDDRTVGVSIDTDDGVDALFPAVARYRLRGKNHELMVIPIEEFSRKGRRSDQAVRSRLFRRGRQRDTDE